MKRCCFFFIAFLASLVLAVVSDSERRQGVSGTPMATAHQARPTQQPADMPGKGLQSPGGPQQKNRKP